MTTDPLKQTADAINRAPTNFFQANLTVTELRAKDLMPILVRARVFCKRSSCRITVKECALLTNPKNLIFDICFEGRKRFVAFTLNTNSGVRLNKV
jgi:hypothetical protein